MNKVDNIIVVKNQSFILHKVIKLNACLLFLVFIVMLISRTFNLILIVSIFMVIFFPSIVCALWIRNFRVSILNSNKIVVKKMFYEKTIDVCNVLSVNVLILDNNFIHSEKINIKTNIVDFSVDNAMENYAEFYDCILKCVPTEKITIKKVDNRK